MQENYSFDVAKLLPLSKIVGLQHNTVLMIKVSWHLFLKILTLYKISDVSTPAALPLCMLRPNLIPLFMFDLKQSKILLDLLFFHSLSS